MSDRTCADEWNDELNRFELTVLFSLVITVGVGIFRVCAKNWIANHLSATFKIMAAVSFLKILLAILLYSVLNPRVRLGAER